MTQFIKVKDTVINTSIITFIDITETVQDDKIIYHIIVSYLNNEPSRFDYDKAFDRDHEILKIYNSLNLT